MTTTTANPAASTSRGLCFDKVTFTYAGMQEAALNSITWTTPHQGIIGILGPNGSGKSTLLKLIAGILKPQEGTIALGDTHVDAWSPHERAKRFAFVPQQSTLEFDYSVREIVAMGRAPHQGWFGREQVGDDQAIQHALDAAELHPLASRPFSTLSGGERQRVAIARALAQQTPWLLLDEPTAHLDLKHREHLFQLLEKLRDGCDLSALFVTHEPEHAKRLCSEVMMLKKGRLAFAGPATEIDKHIPSVFDLPPKI